MLVVLCCLEKIGCMESQWDLIELGAACFFNFFFFKILCIAALLSLHFMFPMSFLLVKILFSVRLSWFTQGYLTRGGD